MAEDIFILGRLDDLSDPRQLEELNQWIVKIQGRINQFDPGSFSLGWIEGYASGAVIASAGVDNAPEWQTAPQLTGLRLSGLTPSQIVMTDASKNLISSSILGVTNGDNHDHVGGDGAQINHNATANLATGDPHAQYLYLPGRALQSPIGPIQIGDSVNVTYIENNGYLRFVGEATAWDDLRITPTAFDYAGAADPAMGNWQPGGSGRVFKVWAFDPSDIGYFTVQLPHSYRHGSNLSVHVHWTPRDRGIAEGTATVAWKLDYSWANIDGTFGASATADMTDACQSADHHHLMTPSIELSGAGKTMSSMLACALYRDTGDTWSGTGATQAPALLEVDFHFEMDCVGSNTASSKL